MRDENAPHRKVIETTTSPATEKRIKAVQRHHVNGRVKRARGYKTDLLDGRSTFYDSTVTRRIGKMVKRREANMKGYHCDDKVTISILRYLLDYGNACDTV